MRSLASVAFGVAFTIVLMLLAAFNRRKSPPAEPRQPPLRTPRPSTPQVAAYYEAIGVCEVSDSAATGGTVIAFRRTRRSEQRAESHGR